MPRQGGRLPRVENPQGISQRGQARNVALDKRGFQVGVEQTQPLYFFSISPWVLSLRVM